ncbi:hypothetical protein YB2330_006631 [Saitoella coloradoensis]
MKFSSLAGLLGAQASLLGYTFAHSSSSSSSSSSTPCTADNTGGSGTSGSETTPYAPQKTVEQWKTIGVAQNATVNNNTAPLAGLICPGYTLSNLVHNTRGLSAGLTLAGEGCNVYGNDIKELVLSVSYETKSRVHVKIVDAGEKQWQVPEEIAPSPEPLEELSEDELDYSFSYTAQPFAFWITRTSDAQILFDTRTHPLVFEDQFIQLTTNMVQDYNVYGLGETIAGWRIGNNATRTIYAADIGDVVDANLYGYHPFYLEQRFEGQGFESSGDALSSSIAIEEGPCTTSTTVKHNGFARREKESSTTSAASSKATSSAGDSSSSAHGVFLRSSNDMDVLLREDYLQYRITGGILDLYIYTGPTPLTVTQQYVQSIGLPAMQQYWTFGFHQCRWGYSNLSELVDVVESFKEFGIPLETIWTDIDYMDFWKDWTVSPNRYPADEFLAFTEGLRSGGQHYVPIVDAAIYRPDPNNATDSEYESYYRGHELDAWIKNPDGTEYVGAVWPGYTVFPDFFANGTQTYWTEALVNFSKLVDYSGIWLDMNEVSSFCVGSCGSNDLGSQPILPPFALGGVSYDYPEGFNVSNATEAAAVSSASAAAAASASASSLASPSPTNTVGPTVYAPEIEGPYGTENINYPPYAIHNWQQNGDLAGHAVSPNATHANGIREYDVHSLFGYMETIATYNGLLEHKPNERPFIISRSTYPGSGKYAGHWGGDNYSKWAYMAFSIPQAFMFQMFGIPMFGVDTCGFAGNTDEELCNRWMQLSAFFPFYRNHNTLGALSQEPYRWASVAEASKTAMKIRYSLLPYMYTLFYEASKTGAPVMNPLSFLWPNDASLVAADRQFVLGEALMVTPVLEPDVDYTMGVFPGVANGEVWYDWYTHAKVDAVAGQNTTIPAPLGHIPLFVRGGYILPMQTPGYTTDEARNGTWSLLVALDSEGSAEGEIYLDDGVSVEQESTEVIRLSVASGSLKASTEITGSVLPQAEIALEKITILGITSKPKSVSFNGKSCESVCFNSTSGELIISEFGNAGVWVQDWTLEWQ